MEVDEPLEEPEPEAETTEVVVGKREKKKPGRKPKVKVFILNNYCKHADLNCRPTLLKYTFDFKWGSLLV